MSPQLFPRQWTDTPDSVVAAPILARWLSWRPSRVFSSPRGSALAPLQSTRCSSVGISALPEFRPNLPECDRGELADVVRRQSFQSSGTAERYATYPKSGTLLVRATGTRTNGRDMHA